jgi:ribosome maturation factor RimP
MEVGWHPARRLHRPLQPSEALLTPNPDLDATLAAIIAPVVAAMGLELVRIQLGVQEGGRVLQIMAEDPATGQLTLDQCAALSRALDAPLEQADPIPGDYALEVSSPGIDRPLTRRGDFERWAGFDAKLVLRAPIDGRVRVQGVLGALEDDILAIELKSGTRLVVRLDNVASAKLVLTDRLLAATRPLDASGADEVIEVPPALPADTDHDDAGNDNETDIDIDSNRTS